VGPTTKVDASQRLKTPRRRLGFQIRGSLTNMAHTRNEHIQCNQTDTSFVGVGVDHTLDQGVRREDGNLDPFIALYRTEYPGMVRLAHALTGDPGAAEDIVQEAFIRVQRHFVETETPRGYLRTTVVNLCRDRARRRHRERGLGLRIESYLPLSMEASEMMDVLLRLPYKQRAVLVLRYWADWSEADIAESLGCRPGTVKALASRGLARLRREIDP
jgi:RNA polymerase sigma-70 factor (sigma-E family)